MFGVIVPNGRVVEVEGPVVVALLPNVVEVARVETVKVKVVSIAAVTLTPFTIATRVSAEFNWLPPMRITYEPVDVGFVILLFKICNAIVPDAMVLLAQTVNVKAVVLVASVTRLLPALQEVTIVLLVEVTSDSNTFAILPKRLVVGSKV